MNRNELLEQLQRMTHQREIDLREGVPALKRLMGVALSNTGQARAIAAFLLGVYGGERFKFDLSDFRLLDQELVDDCIKVIRMDSIAQKSVNEYFDDPDLFERLANTWGYKDAGLWPNAG